MYSYLRMFLPEISGRISFIWKRYEGATFIWGYSEMNKVGKVLRDFLPRIMNSRKPLIVESIA
jgi:hypothetical protein